MKKITLASIFLITNAVLIGCASKELTYTYEPAEYELPDPLVTLSGERITGAEAWREVRRPEILELFTTEVYGRAPDRPADMTFDVFDNDPNALSGRATRKQVRVNFKGDENDAGMDLLIYLSNQVKKPKAVFLLLNFLGNHMVHRDRNIALSRVWFEDKRRRPVVYFSRGLDSFEFPLDMILARGYGLATVHSEELARNHGEGYENGGYKAFDDYEGERPPEAWGTIAAWAWGLSRAMDYFETDPDIDHTRVAVLGHSRLGKAALWAGAQDERFAIVISNDSGCAGAALFRRRVGEKIVDMNKWWPQWLCEKSNKYNDRENDMPVDQHMLIALMAPRLVYVASAVKDYGTDPIGEFLSAHHADPVYKMLGTEGLPVDELPPVDQPAMGAIGYHIRKGGHALTRYDWEQYVNFADMHWASRESEKRIKHIRKGSMQTISVNVYIHAPIEDVWKVFSDHEGYTRMSKISYAKLLEEGQGDRNGLGAIREIHLAGGEYIEEIMVFEPPTRLDYKVRECSMPMEHDVGNIRLAVRDQGTEVQWSTTYRIKTPLLGGLLTRISMPYTRRIFHQCLLDVKQQMESE
jgi:hypothetical protein